MAAANESMDHRRRVPDWGIAGSHALATGGRIRPFGEPGRRFPSLVEPTDGVAGALTGFSSVDGALGLMACGRVFRNLSFRPTSADEDHACCATRLQIRLFALAGAGD